MDELTRLTSDVEVLIVDSTTCNDECLKGLDLSSFLNLRVFEVGDECLKNVTEVKLIGLSQLERVVIGKHCFRRIDSCNSKGHFYLKNCERLRELIIGCYSFSDYSVCVIENVPSLEVIEMGELNEDSYNFKYSSLELKSDCDEMK